MGKFLDNRLKYHTASRVGAQTGYSLAQALDPDGHIVRHNSVWTAPTSDFPMNVSATTKPDDATTDLVAVFKNGAVAHRTVGNGTVYRNELYPAVELFEAVEMTGVSGSDGVDSDLGKGKGATFQAYEIRENGARVMDWVAPTAVLNTSNTPQAGYSGIAEAHKDTTWTILQKDASWALSAGTWEFVYMSGLLIFEPSVTPLNKDYDNVRFTGFKYIGATLDDSIDGVAGDLEGVQGDISTINNNITNIVNDLEWMSDEE